MSILDEQRLWEYTVLATDAAYPLEAIAQLYRDRCDGENGFGELTNQWGLSGFTTQDIKRCQTTARAGALVVNIRAALRHVKHIAEQLPNTDRWATLVRYICQSIAPPIPAPIPSTAIAGAG